MYTMMKVTVSLYGDWHVSKVGAALFTRFAWAATNISATANPQVSVVETPRFTGNVHVLVCASFDNCNFTPQK